MGRLPESDPTGLLATVSDLAQQRPDSRQNTVQMLAGSVTWAGSEEYIGWIPAQFPGLFLQGSRGESGNHAPDLEKGGGRERDGRTLLITSHGPATL